MNAIQNLTPVLEVPVKQKPLIKVKGATPEAEPPPGLKFAEPGSKATPAPQPEQPARPLNAEEKMKAATKSAEEAVAAMQAENRKLRVELAEAREKRSEMVDELAKERGKSAAALALAEIHAMAMDVAERARRNNGKLAGLGGRLGAVRDRLKETLDLLPE